MKKMLFLVASLIFSLNVFAEAVCNLAETCVSKSVNGYQLATVREDLLTLITGPRIVSDLITESAESMIGRSWQQNMVKQWLLNNRGYAELLGSYVGLIPALIGSQFGIVTVIDSQFADGSKATFQLSGLGHSAALKLSLVSISDANGIKKYLKEKPKMELSVTTITYVFLPIALILSFIVYRLNRKSDVPLNFIFTFGLTLIIFPIGVLYFLYLIGVYYSHAQKTQQLEKS